MEQARLAGPHGRRPAGRGRLQRGLQERAHCGIDAIWKASIPTREIVELRNMILVGRLVAEDANDRTENRGLHYNKDIISVDG